MLLLFGGPKEFNCQKKKIWNYPDLESARRPVPHCEEVPVPEFSNLPDVFMEYDEFHKEVESSASDSGGSVFESSSSIPEQIKQEELSDLIRDLDLFKEAAEILISRLKDKNCLRTGASILPYKRKILLPYFSKELVYFRHRRTSSENGSTSLQTSRVALIHRQFEKKFKICITA